MADTDTTGPQDTAPGAPTPVPTAPVPAPVAAAPAAADEPDDAEVAAAMAVINKKQTAIAARAEAAKPALRTIVAMTGFEEVLAESASQMANLDAGSMLYNDLNAIVIGMNNLKTHVA